MMPRVLILARSLGMGGTERQLVLLANGLAHAGYRVALALFYDEGELKDALQGVRCRILGKRGRFDLYPALRGLRRLIMGERASILYSFLTVPNIFNSIVIRLIPRGLRPVSLWGVRSTNMTDGDYDPISKFSYRVQDFLRYFPDRIVVNSFSGREYLLSKGYSDKKILVIHNGIDTGHFRFDSVLREKFRRKYGIAENVTAIGSVARLDPMKGYETLIGAFSLLTKKADTVYLVIKGHGHPQYVNKIKRLIDDYNIGSRVKWVDKSEDVVAVYSGIDVFCLASRYGEGFSNAIAEAMSTGLPCVATDVGDSRTILGNYGRIVPPNDQGALINALREEVLKWKRGSKGRTTGRQHIQDRFSVESMIEQHRQLFEG